MTTAISVGTFALLFRKGELAGRRFELAPPRQVVLGRGADSGLIVPDTGVSRRHCEIDLGLESARVRDLGSSNGTFVDGQRVTGAWRDLPDGSVLRLSDVVAKVEVAAADATVVGPPRSWHGHPIEGGEDAPALPGYVIVRCLGQGAHGVVYEARTAADELVAVKVLKVSASDDACLRFEREANVAMALEHPNLIRVFEHGETARGPFLVMELVRGETLSVRLKREGRLPVLDALAVARQIASALAYTHEKKIVHRDVKPDNIVIAGDGTAKLTDFGLAKSVETAGRSGLTRECDVLGTLAYMSPEQLQCSVRADHEADVYSLGATVYHALTGRAAFTSRTPAGMFEKILREVPVPVRDLRPDVPHALAATVERCLAKAPADRPAATELARTFGFFLSDASTRTTKG